MADLYVAKLLAVESDSLEIGGSAPAYEVQTKLQSAGGIEKSSGLGIKLDGSSLTLSASGIKVSDSVINNRDWKESCRIASDANLASLTGVTLSDFDGQGQGVTLTDDDRVLLWKQSTGSENGIYVVTNESGGTGDLVRASDADADAEVTAGLTVFSTEGTYADNGFLLTTNDPITVGTTSLTFSVYTSGSSITAGDGLSQSGSDFDVNAGDGIAIVSDDVTVDLTDTTTFVATSAGAGDSGKAPVLNASGKLDRSFIQYRVPRHEKLTLTGTDITNKYKDLTDVPIADESVELEFGGINQEEGVQWSLITDGSEIKRISWNGLGLESGQGALAASDILRAYYYKE